MHSLELMAVGLTATEHDAHLLEYARMLAERGIVKKLDLVHVADEPAMAPSEFEKVKNDLEALAARSLDGIHATVQTSLRILAGPREDILCGFLERERHGVVLLGHNVERSSGKRSLARRLAMISPACVWVIPENAPPKITKVLAPVDFSPHSEDSLSVASGICEKLALAECECLHVYFDPAVYRFEDHDAVKQAEENKKLEQFLRPLNTHGVSVKCRVERGSNVARTVLRIAQENNQDLIVVSTRGRSRAASILLGSETSQLIMESNIPILAVKHRGAKLKLLDVLTSNELWRRPESDIHY